MLVQIVGFASSLIETGMSPTLMGALRAKLHDVGVATYDAFSPEIMDAIAWHKTKIARYPELT